MRDINGSSLGSPHIAERAGNLRIQWRTRKVTGTLVVRDMRTSGSSNDRTEGGEAEVLELAAAQPALVRGLRLIAERARRMHFIEADEVDYLEAEGNYVTLHVGADRYLTRQTLTELARLLEPLEFLRIERGLVVNLRQVYFVERLERGSYAFTLKRGHRLTSSRERAASISRLLRGACLPADSSLR